ncbi:MAG: prephenate dehydratase domain-containing protein [Eubacteriales bacterium]
MQKRWNAGDRNGMPLKEKIQITDANLARLDKMEASVAEMREALLVEKVRAMAAEITNEYPEDICEQLIRDEHFPELFRNMTERGIPVPDEMLSKEQIGYMLSFCNHAEQISLCRYLAHVNDGMYKTEAARRGSSWERNPREDAEHPYGSAWIAAMTDLTKEEDHIEDETAPDLDVRTPRPVGERIAYLRNTYTDRAYTRFQTVLHHTTATYYSDFPGVCEALYYDRASACILPMENSVDGKLLRFYALLNKYDLRIAYTCSVTTEDTDVTTRYALLRKSVAVPHPQEIAEDEGLYMECRVILRDDHPLSDLLCAAVRYHLKLTRVDSIPTDYGDGEYVYDLILRAEEGADFAAMITYLHLLVPQFTLFGIYLTV